MLMVALIIYSLAGSVGSKFICLSIDLTDHLDHGSLIHYFKQIAPKKHQTHRMKKVLSLILSHSCGSQLMTFPLKYQI